MYILCTQRQDISILAKQTNVYFRSLKVMSNAAIYSQWMIIQDIIGNASSWPYSIRRIFWRKPLKHFDRILLCTFAYVNGLNPDILFEWIDLLTLTNRAGVNHMRALFRLFENGNYSRSLYAWNITNHRYEYLDGSVRLYQHASLR